jgi:hypothetical protein
MDNNMYLRLVVRYMGSAMTNSAGVGAASAACGGAASAASGGGAQQKVSDALRCMQNCLVNLQILKLELAIASWQCDSSTTVLDTRHMKIMT